MQADARVGPTVNRPRAGLPAGHALPRAILRVLARPGTAIGVRGAPLFGLYPGVDAATVVLAIQAVLLAEIHRLPEAILLAERLWQESDAVQRPLLAPHLFQDCLLYTSDAADD